MKWTPLLFSGEMARGMVENRKWQTRRLKWLHEVNWKPDDYDLAENDGLYWMLRNGRTGMEKRVKCPFGVVGDWIWGRETWAYCSKCGDRKPMQPSGVVYRADGDGFSTCHICDPVTLKADVRWRPSIHMPRWASRIERELVGIRLERVQDISEEDAIAEGVHNEMNIRWMSGDDTIIGMFGNLWDSINEPRGYGWEHNPWVWVLEFPRVDVFATNDTNFTKEK